MDKAKDTPKDVRGSFMMVMFDIPYLSVNLDLNKSDILISPSDPSSPDGVLQEGRGLTHHPNTLAGVPHQNGWLSLVGIRRDTVL